MSLRKAEGPLAVHMPARELDRPSWIGVGSVAAAGFAIGVAWPHLAGVRPGPSVPESSTASSQVLEPSAEPSASSSAPVVVAAPTRAPSSAPSATPPVALPAAVAPPAGSHVSVTRGSVLSCKAAGGDTLKGNDCGAISALDGVILPRLRKLADCPDAATENGRLRLIVRADFARNGLGVELGREHSVTAVDPLLTCAKASLNSASLEGIAHENARYTVAYTVTFSGPQPPAAASSPETASSSPSPSRGGTDVGDGTAQVEWEVGLVRDAPKTGKVIARLPRGTVLHVGPAKDGWYPAKYGDGFSNEGWIYRGAIGR